VKSTHRTPASAIGTDPDRLGIQGDGQDQPWSTAEPHRNYVDFGRNANSLSDRPRRSQPKCLNINASERSLLSQIGSNIIHSGQ
jgi:hypothetical protein